jgi:hypothetical protein
MNPDSPQKDWPQQLASCWVDSAEVLSAEADEEEKPGLDSLGNPGKVLVVRHVGRLGVRRPRGRVVKDLLARGLTSVRDTAEETELARPRAVEQSVDVDPFLLEKSVVVTVRGRDFPGHQRAMIEAKLEALRREYEDASTPPDRRDAAAKLLGQFEEGMTSTLDVRSVVRRFRPVVALKDPVDAMGRLFPITAGMRIVYRVDPLKPDAGEEVETEPMVFHVVALGVREAVVLYTGGVHGQRHLRDLEDSVVHHAWFANRERVKTDATAPWIGRRLYRDLAERGAGEIVVHKRRDPAPIGVEKMGEGRACVVVDGRQLEVPVLVCKTKLDDELVVLADPENPLLLRLYESGAELVRTIDAIHSAPGRPFTLPEAAA